MKPLGLVLVLGIGSSAAFAATVPTKQECVSLRPGNNGTTYISNTCSEPVSIQVNWSSGRQNTINFRPGQSMNSNWANEGVHTYACPVEAKGGYMQSASPDSFTPTNYNTTEYWCLEP